MFGRKNTTGVSTAEVVTRTIQYAGQRVAGERGGQVANAVTGALGLGRIEMCDAPDCEDCAPVK